MTSLSNVLQIRSFFTHTDPSHCHASPRAYLSSIYRSIMESLCSGSAEGSCCIILTGGDLPPWAVLSFISDPYMPPDGLVEIAPHACVGLFLPSQHSQHKNTHTHLETRLHTHSLSVCIEAHTSWGRIFIRMKGVEAKNCQQGSKVTEYEHDLFYYASLLSRVNFSPPSVPVFRLTIHRWTRR